MIPIMGTEQLSGPPPPELHPRFRVIKMCVLGMLASFAGKLFCGLLTGHIMGMVSSSLNLILLCVVGIFLLNEDEHLKVLYNFMQTTCCHFFADHPPCQDQCRGGMSCLLSFVICCAMTVFLDIVLGGVIQVIYSGFEMFLQGRHRIIAMVYVLSTASALVSQIVGAWYGWKAYKEARDIGTSVVPGSWADEQAQAGGGGGNAAPASSSMWGGGWAGGGGAGAAASGGGSQPPPGGFQAFSGSGNRLGGE
mmetsp:Transcript_8265/g.24374  ORF Transcript_8265/g.24374 Transcript_8265/m.24374 type:complete len:250 (-) Transcript_8265:41-790(-)